MADFGGVLGSKNNPNCPPLSTLSIHHDTPRLHQQAFLPPMARTHLFESVVASLMKNHYFNTGC